MYGVVYSGSANVIAIAYTRMLSRPRRSLYHVSVRGPFTRSLHPQTALENKKKKNIMASLFNLAANIYVVFEFFQSGHTALLAIYLANPSTPKNQRTSPKFCEV